MFQKAENEEAFKGWLKEKNSQFKKEKLLKRRQEQEMHEGYYIRSREDCEKAYKQYVIKILYSWKSKLSDYF